MILLLGAAPDLRITHLYIDFILLLDSSHLTLKSQSRSRLSAHAVAVSVTSRLGRLVLAAARVTLGLAPRMAHLGTSVHGRVARRTVAVCEGGRRTSEL